MRFFKRRPDKGATQKAPVSQQQQQIQPASHNVIISPPPATAPTHDAISTDHVNSEPKQLKQQSLWDRAYEALQKEDPRLVDDYEALLAKDAATADANDSQARILDGPSRETQLNAIISNGLQRVNSQKARYTIAGHEFELRDQLSQAGEFVIWIKDWVGDAVKVSPEASMAWAGVCLVLPVLTNPKIAEDANRDGFTKVTSRMRYFTKLEQLIGRLSENGGVSADLMEEVNKHVVSLYRSILEFEIRSILRFFQSAVGRYVRDIFSADTWVQMTDRIDQLEATVNRELEQINGLAFRQEMEKQNSISSDALDRLRLLLTQGETQIQISRDQLQIQQEKIAQERTEHEEQCHQLFRLATSGRDVTYEWYKNRVEDWLEGTCQWFLNHGNFQTWLGQQDSGLLLVSADPGCGKSVLAKFLVDIYLPRQLPSATICYFFFKDNDQNTIKQVLNAVLHQLFSQQWPLIRHAMTEFSKNGKGLVNATSSLWSILEAAIQDPEAVTPVVIVLDALDECAESDLQDLAKMFNNLVQGAGRGRLKLLLTTRPYEHVILNFADLTAESPHIRVPGEEESDSIAREVNLVIKDQIGKLARRKRLPQDVKLHLERQLLDAPQQRTYLWVYLVFDYLGTEHFKKTKKGVEAAIATLPGSINQAYEKILDRSKDRIMVRKALSIVLAASRPLTLAEMNVAIYADISSRSIEDLDLEGEKEFYSSLRDWCGLFISVSHGKIYFLHQTAREFLLASTPSESSGWQHSITLEYAHSVLMESCLAYLGFYNAEDSESEPDDQDSNNSGTNDNDDEDEDKDGNVSDEAATKVDYRTAFLDYSAKNWGFHAREASTSAITTEAITNTILEICDPDSKSYSTWFEIYWTEEGHHWPAHIPTLLTASILGHDSIVSLLINRGADMEDKDDEYKRTPLLWAAQRNREKAVKVLLERGAAVDPKDSYGRTPLSFTAERGYKEVAKLLLDNGASTEAMDDYGRAPLSWAAEYGQESVAKLLLDRGANIEVQNRFGRTPLLRAAEFGQEALVKLLLSRGADVNARNNYGRSSLSWAAQKGLRGIVKMLLSKGADVEVEDDYGETPLSLAYYCDDERIVSMLLAKRRETLPEHEADYMSPEEEEGMHSAETQ